MDKASNVIIFGLSSSSEIAVEIADYLKIELGTTQRSIFADGEILVIPESSVRGREVFVVQSTSKPVNDSLMELLIFLDAIKRSSASKVNVIIPYFGYARQDRKSRGRQPITAKLVADLIQTAGANKVMVFDLHAPQIQGFFNIPVDNLKGNFLIANYINTLKLSAVTIASPDVGGMVRARELAKLINSDELAVIDKRRQKANQSEVMNVLGNVTGRDVIIIDDMIDTGGTIIGAVNAFKEKGAKSVIVAATHGVFSKDAIKRLDESSAVTKVIVTDSIMNKDLPEKFVVLSTAEFLGDMIDAEHSHQSLSNVYRLYESKAIKTKIKSKK